ncbi:hypothetical protein BDW66DRAFT_149962 [Aspergillus desertorum]
MRVRTGNGQRFWWAENYIALFRSHLPSQGGPAWEFNNHGVLRKDGDHEYYAYGGNLVRELDLPRIPAGENRTVDLPLNSSSLSQETWLTVEFKLNEDKAWANNGHVLAWDHSSPGFRRPRSGTKPHKPPNINGISSFGFDLLRGNITWKANGRDHFQRGSELYFIRAMTQIDEDQSGNGAEWDGAWGGTIHTKFATSPGAAPRPK